MGKYYGFGVVIKDDAITKDKSDIFSIISKAPKFGKACLNALEKHMEKGYSVSEMDVSNLIDYLTNGASAGILCDYPCCGLASILQMVIDEVEGLNMTAQCDEDTGENLLVMVPELPWCFSEKEKEYTPECVKTALRKYLDAVIVQPFDIGEIEWS